MEQFKHISLELKNQRKLIYTAMSKHLFYYRTQISKFVIEKGEVPLNPFMIFDYFLNDSIERDKVRECNNNLVQRADEVWIFGPISDGVLAEILLSYKMEKKVRFFEIIKSRKIVEISNKDVKMEKDVEKYRQIIKNAIEKI